MNIGEAARRSGLTPKMIRHYEQIGLLPVSARSAAGYREYDETALAWLRFIHQARQLGFSLEQIQPLLALWQDAGRSSAEVKALATEHIRELDARLAALSQMRDQLAGLVACCAGDDRPACPILDHLAGKDTDAAG
ncbi:MAG: Cu(I)-responsive transcriptional regulator [Aeromonadaceae bacterium]|nr:Cu(I)-responsive transcriptional regulator [Aeromonadaceae bacterium]